MSNESALPRYEGAHQAEYFKDYFSKAYTTFGKRKIFVNEFAPTSGDVQANAEFIKEVVKWMDGVDYIVGELSSPELHFSPPRQTQLCQQAR